MLRGIDVSSVQGHCDWPRIAALGIRFSIAKVAEGNRAFADMMARDNIHGARAAGLVVGGYHFAYPLPPKNGEPLRDPEAQAQHHVDIGTSVGLLPGDIWACDLEWPAQGDWAQWGCSGPQIRQWCVRYLESMADILGFAPLVYTYPSWAMAIGMGGEPRLAQYPLWMASYPPVTGWPSPADKPTIAKPWTSYAFWQTSGGTFFRLPTTAAPCDTDLFNGDEAELAAFCHRAPAPIGPVASVQVIDPPDPPDAA